MGERINTIPLLDSPHLLMRADLFRGLNAIAPDYFINLRDYHAVTASWERFVAEEVASGGLRMLLTHYLTNPEVSVNDFGLTVFARKSDGVQPPETERFFFDTNFGLVLSLPSWSPPYAWCVGFSMVFPENHSSYQKRGVQIQSLAAVELLIEQIQGPTYEKSGQPFPGLRWEKVLVTLVCQWAQRKGLNRILLQPAVLNRYYVSPLAEENTWEKELRQRLHLHYDVTAQRLGFQKNGVGNLYSLPLQRFPP